MKKTGLNGYVYDFSVDYNAIVVDDILYIHNYLIKKIAQYNKTFRFVKLIFISAMMFFGCSLPILNSLKCISVNNQECKVRPQIVNVDSEEPAFFPFSIKISKWSGSCNNINDPYVKLCFSGVVKNLNVRVFNLMSGTNETRHIEQHEDFKCKCRLDDSVCKNKQRWNEDKCRCECGELIDKDVCDKRFIWNLSNCECECDKSCDLGEYLDYENCKRRKNQLINWLKSVLKMLKK